jgi:hypothetical protein
MVWNPISATTFILRSNWTVVLTEIKLLNCARGSRGVVCDAVIGQPKFAAFSRITRNGTDVTKPSFGDAGTIDGTQCAPFDPTQNCDP